MIRARLQLFLAVVLGVAALATSLWPTWIESLTGLEPDGGSGGTEWWLVTLLALAACVVAVRAWRGFRAVAAPRA